MDKIKIAVLGCGSIAEIAHFPAIAKREDADLVAVCDADEKTAEEAAAKWNAGRWFTDYREMFDKVAMDAVIVATPNHLHRNQVIAAANRKIDILVEKPIAVTNKEAWDMVDACRKNGVKLMVGCTADTGPITSGPSS